MSRVPTFKEFYLLRKHGTTLHSRVFPDHEDNLVIKCLFAGILEIAILNRRKDYLQKLHDYMQLEASRIGSDGVG